MNYGGDWATYYDNYNNFGEAFTRMAEFSQTNWMYNMYKTQNSRGPHMTP